MKKQEDKSEPYGPENKEFTKCTVLFPPSKQRWYSHLTCIAQLIKNVSANVWMLSYIFNQCSKWWILGENNITGCLFAQPRSLCVVICCCMECEWDVTRRVTAKLLARVVDYGWRTLRTIRADWGLRRSRQQTTRQDGKQWGTNERYCKGSATIPP